MATVMIADDSVIDRETLRDALEGTHEVVCEATNGVEAVKRYSKFRPDVVLMDLVMPHMNGTEAARMILQANPKAVIIPVSGLAQPSVMMEADSVGMMGFINKPIEKAELLGEIEGALR